MKPRIFVGSSAEGLDVAYAIQTNLDHDAEVTVWSQGAFEPSKFTLESIIEILEGSDFGVFVFTPDDVVTMRGEEKQAVRDNVLFELGVFIGRLGRDRSFIVMPKGNTDLQLPSDLLGLTPLQYNPNRRDKNLQAALGPACNRLRSVLDSLGVLPTPDEVEETAAKDLSEADILALLQSWMGSRDARLNTRAITYDEVDKELGLPPGSTRKYIERVASRWDYVVEHKGEHTILFKDAPDKYIVSRRSRWDRF
ncbi:hypothetical protein CRI93_12420 [Longimonas halophila]|uniref:CD-NTase-associated protein 12/Pycsar effector protein TIR domain-containing protein n=1 Tax=Longimonas halophila TaxID=1469170 RepID=A0A2H3NLR5_9BACT|nr:nucleotide-binding protein [Longimonas halophila]PEN05502.1 hypothetical protein CRI93_12420 [Longimonas halophila]